MKLESFAILSVLLAGAHAHAGHNHHARHVQLAARQAVSSSAPASSTAAAATGAASSSAAPAATSAPAATAAASGIRPLSEITSGMPPLPTLPVATTFTAGATPSFSGAPPLPTKFVFSAADWPALDKVATTDSALVKEWLKEIDGWDIPSLDPTTEGDCSLSPAAAADAAKRGWWTCGGYTRDTDITTCPDKFTWGVSFDDGPSDYTQQLLDFLDTKNVKSTFFVVGSRVVSHPDLLIEEYMKGHEISAHTWSHHPLTSLTNEQIVAELGYTREAIKRVLGVTPTTMRPPFGDIDDRVRAISLAMGMTPIMWTSTATPGGIKMDTNDWRVAAGQMNGEQQFASFQSILGNASTLNSGFIVLEHDLFDITVELACGYTLNSALAHDPKFNLEPIGQCNKIQMADMYMETTTNKTYLAQRQKATVNTNSSVTNATGSTAAGNTQTSSGSGSDTSGASPYAPISALTALVAAGVALML